jgi:hypothetical protein
MNNEQKKQAWQALQHFYKMKSVLLPEFLQRNKQSLNSIEAELMREYKNKDEKWLCMQCGKRKEEYESMYCDKCWYNHEDNKTK